MDFGWSAGPLAPPGGASDLNLLSDNFLVDLDDRTLQARPGGHHGAPQPPQWRGPGPAAAARPLAARAACTPLQPWLLVSSCLCALFHAAGCQPLDYPHLLPQCLMGGPSGAAFATCMSGGAGEASGSAGGGGSGNKREREEEPAAGELACAWGSGLQACPKASAAGLPGAGLSPAVGMRETRVRFRRRRQLLPAACVITVMLKPCLSRLALPSSSDEDDDSEEGGGGGRARGRAAKKGKAPAGGSGGGAGDAASVKATREKARREKLNEWCAGLLHWLAYHAAACAWAVCSHCVPAACQQPVVWLALRSPRRRLAPGPCPPLIPAPQLSPLPRSFEELARLCDPSGKMLRTDRISIVQGEGRCGARGAAGWVQGLAGVVC